MGHRVEIDQSKRIKISKVGRVGRCNSVHHLCIGNVRRSNHAPRRLSNIQRPSLHPTDNRPISPLPPKLLHEEKRIASADVNAVISL